MAATEWVALIGAAGGLLTIMAKGFAWIIDKIVSSKNDVIGELKASLDDMQKDRDYWRDKAEGRVR